MHVRYYGTSGAPVLILHGGPAAVGDVAPVARGLSASFRTAEPWQRGSGREPLTVARHIADLHELVSDRYDATAPALVGHSWGAMLALCYAAEHPGNTGPIVLVGCGTFDQAARRRLQETIEGRMDDDLRDRLTRVSIDGADPADEFVRGFKLTRHLYDFDPIEPYADKDEFEPFDIQAHHETWNDMAKLQDDGTYPGAFAAIRSPVLMLHGQYDPHPGEMIRDSLLPYIPHLEYHDWPRCGHSPWIERAARVAFFSVICAWLEERTA